MTSRALDALCKIAGRSAILVLALLWGPGAACAAWEEVTATKNSSGAVTYAKFSIKQDQWIRFQAVYTGQPHSFWISMGGVSAGPNEAGMQLTTGVLIGCALLHGSSQATYHISVDLPQMGPGSYSIRYDPTGNSNLGADVGCKNGQLSGDPHVTTVNGVRYDFQSAGEFVALRGESGMEIQTRQTPLPALPRIADSYSGLAVGVALNTAVAARVNDHRVTYQMGPPRPAGAPPALELRVDGVLTELRPAGLALGWRGRLSPVPDNGIRIDFPDGTALVVTSNFWPAANLWYLNLDVSHTPAHKGIMGSIEGRNWLPALPDGSLLGPKPRSAHQRYVDLYERFANAWRVTERGSLFDYERGTSTADFIHPGWPHEIGPAPVFGTTEPQPLRKAAARRACRGIAGRHLRRNCVFDVRVTGERGFASSYRRVERVRRGTTVTGLSSERVARDAAEPATFVASVASQSRNRRDAIAGAVQFLVDGADNGAPVRLGADGRASWRAPRLNAGEHWIAARYLPAAGSLFLPSESTAIAHMVRHRH